MAYKREHVKESFRPKPDRLLDQVREVMRYHHYAIRTEQTYVKWMLDYIRFNGIRHPREMGKPEIERFLSHLAVNRNVASSTQNQVPMNGDEITFATIDLHINNCTALSVKILDNVPYVRFTRIFPSILVQLII